MNLASLLIERRRLGVLELIHFSGGPLNVHVLAEGLSQAGIPSDEPETRAAAEWLAKNGFAFLANRNWTTVVRISGEGTKIVTGARVAPGIAIPGA